jgi:hypothetical protein
MNVELGDVPPGPVQPQRLAGVRVDFDRGYMSEAGLLQAKRLATGSGADFQAAQLRQGTQLRHGAQLTHRASSRSCTLPTTMINFWD